MSDRDVVIVFDCGATNVRVVAIDSKGKILASESSANITHPDPYYPEYRIWDIGEIWTNMCQAAQRTISRINPDDILGVTVTTFGVDGTLFDKNGMMLYPVISWQCERTNPVMSDIGKYIPLIDLYKENGVLPFNFNTINKLIWFNENRAEILEKSHRFLFMPSIFLFLLSGEMINDVTMAGTSMMTNLATRQFSENIFRKIGLPGELMGSLVEAGSVVGKVTKKASEETSIPRNLPVVATGHDTQFAIFGSGAEKNQPVLSSGTWEILMVRAEKYKSGKEQLNLQWRDFTISAINGLLQESLNGYGETFTAISGRMYMKK
jgi:L-fuculokinase